ncbi:vWA domain-containing protein [Marinicrinis sediminis]|uniref:VWA domain-containing protein n=1 Tax=Marinicrinis sediminis TaxID=1652465 RepID=A0ABW5RAY0_9BACL
MKKVWKAIAMVLTFSLLLQLSPVMIMNWEFSNKVIAKADSAKKENQSQGKQGGHGKKEKDNRANENAAQVHKEKAESLFEQIIPPHRSYAEEYHAAIWEADQLFREGLEFQSEGDHKAAFRAYHDCWKRLKDYQEIAARFEEDWQVIQNDPDGDADGDGLINQFEIDQLHPAAYPNNVDTDTDGIADGEEDADRDGLSNLEEQALGTDPMDKDTDQDGLVDAAELKFGTDPLNPDSDGDGILDGQEQFEQRITHESSGAEVTIWGPGDLSQEIRIHNATEITVTDHVYAVSPVIELQTDQTFEKAKINIPVDMNRLGDRALEQVKMVYYDEEKMTYVPLDVQGIDEANGTVWGETDHFSLYTLFYFPNLSEIWQIPFHAGERSSETATTFIDVMMIIDSSGSMSWNDPNGYRKTAAKNFVDALIPGSRVGVVVGDRAGVVDFDSSAKLLKELSDDFEGIKSSIDTIDSSGGTNIGAGVHLANEQLIQHSDESRIKVEVLLTDGEGSYSTAYTDQAIQNGITIYTIGLGNNLDQSLLQEIAGRTGGQYFHVSDASELPIVYDRISEIITDPADSDEDGIPDSVEIKGIRTGLFFSKLVMTDPHDPDSDDDGLLDGEEVGEAFEINLFNQTYSYYPMYSHPLLPDTDGDQLSDFEERKVYGTKSLTADSDFDSLSDYEEVHYVPDDQLPLSADGNAGSSVQISSSYTPYLNPPYWDTDGDGFSDKEEYNGTQTYTHSSSSHQIHLVPYIFDRIIDDENYLEITGTETWQGRIHLLGQVLVEKQGRLTIQPRSRVISYNSKSLNEPFSVEKFDLTVEGTLQAGSSLALDQYEDTIIFEDGKVDEAYWSGILATPESRLNLVNVAFFNARNALFLDEAVDLHVANSVFYRNHDSIKQLHRSFFGHNGGTSDISIEESYFSRTGTLTLEGN